MIMINNPRRISKRRLILLDSSILTISTSWWMGKHDSSQVILHNPRVLLHHDDHQKAWLSWSWGGWSRKRNHQEEEGCFYLRVEYISSDDAGKRDHGEDGENELWRVDWIQHRNSDVKHWIMTVGGCDSSSSSSPPHLILDSGPQVVTHDNDDREYTQTERQHNGSLYHAMGISRIDSVVVFVYHTLEPEFLSGGTFFIPSDFSSH